MPNNVKTDKPLTNRNDGKAFPVQKTVPPMPAVKLPKAEKAKE